MMAHQSVELIGLEAGHVVVVGEVSSVGGDPKIIT